jgi:hypothetical protein
MARGSNPSDSKAARLDLRNTSGASRDLSSRHGKPLLIAFYALDEPDPNEAILRAKLEHAGNFAWSRLEMATGSEGPMPFG